MIFNNDPKGREFDVVSDQLLFKLEERKAYFHFETVPTVPADKVIRELREYEKRYNVEIIIDISPLKRWKYVSISWLGGCFRKYW